MVLLVATLDTAQDIQGFLNGWFGHEDRLETAFQGSITLNMLAVIIQGSGPDTAYLASG